MSKKNQLLQDLALMIKQKQSKAFYAKKLGITEGELEDLWQELKDKRNLLPGEVRVTHSIDNETTKRINIDKGEIEINGYWDHEPSPEEIMEAHNLDQSKWKLSQYWSKQKSKGFQVSANFAEKRQDKEDIKESFQTFLETYQPAANPIQPKAMRGKYNTPNGCLIINPQDIHYNKADRKGNNDINERFDLFESKVDRACKKASSTTTLEKIIYVVGSDMFNSEWTGMTTHGTPQQNILSHNAGFEAICQHQVNIISNLLKYSDDVHVTYIVGNHDSYISWHLVTWLKVYFRNEKFVSFDTSDSFTKYIKYSNTALAFNHGYKVKPEALAQAFPIEFKEEWSNCDNYCIFVGDLHTELTKQIGGIQFYRLAQASSAVSRWDEENGYTLSKGTVTAFLIEAETGYIDIIKA